MSPIVHDDKAIFFIDNRQRIDGSASNFTVNVPLERNNNYNRVAVLNASIAKSYYLVPTNATFILREPAQSDVEITFPEGNYNLTNFKTNFQTLLNDNSPSGWVYVVSYPSSTSAQTGKWTISVSGNSSNQPAIVLQNGKLYLQFGFAKDSTNTMVADTITSDNIILLQGETNIFIHSNICLDATDSVLQEVLVNAPDFSILTFAQDNIEMNSRTLTNRDNNSFTFTITDTDDNELEMNEGHVVFSIVCYRANQTHIHHQNDIALRNFSKLGKN